MKTIKIYENETLISEIEHSPRQEQAVKLDIELYNQNGGAKTYEIYEPPPVYTVSELKAMKINSLRNEASRNITANVPEYEQRNAALGIYDEAKTADFKNTINAFRAEVHRVTKLIESATTIKQIENVEWEWPNV